MYNNPVLMEISMKSVFRTIEDVHEHFDNDHFAVDNGIVIEEFGDRTAVCSVELTEHHRNAMGNVMGGVAFTLADYTFAIAASSVHVPTVTMQVSLSFLSNVRGTKLYARAKCIKDGRTSAVYNVDVTDDTGRDIAQFMITGFKL